MGGYEMNANLYLCKYEGAYSSVFAVVLDRLCNAIETDDGDYDGAV